MPKLSTDPNESKKMIDEAALGMIKTAPGNESSLAPLKRFVGELDTCLGSSVPSGTGGQGPAEWQPLQIPKVPVTQTERRGAANAFQVTFPQGVVWGIVGCVMTFAIGLLTERVRGTLVRLRMAPLSRAQVLGGKALARFLSISVLQIVLLTLGAIFLGVRPPSVPLLVPAYVCASGCDDVM